MKKLLTIILAAILLVGCSSKTEKTVDKDKDLQSESINLKVGLMGSDSSVWKYISEVVKEKGIKLEIVYFDSYSIPNAALNDREIDLNAFQHHSYLNAEVEDLNYDLVSAFDTVFAPIGIYSEKIKSLDELENGQTVAIPDDVSNGGRAIKLLEQAGLIEVNEEAGLIPTIKDIKSNPKDLNILELSAANIPGTLAENQIAVINSGIATDAGFTPSKDALVLESVEDENPYINLVAVRSEDKDAEWIKIIEEAYRTDEVKKIIEEDSKGSSIPVW